MNNINELIGIIKAVDFDDIINDQEIARLKDWVARNRNLVYDADQVKLIRLVENILEDDVITEPEKIMLYKQVDEYVEKHGNDIDKIYELNGIIEGIVCDDEVNHAEIIKLKEWMDLNSSYIRGHESSENICKVVDEILKDGIVTEDEQGLLLDVLKNRISGSKFETKYMYLCKMIKDRKNVGVELIDLLDNEDAMNEIHRRAEERLHSILKSYSKALYRSETVFLSLCLIAMLDYDGSYFDSVRVVYADLYKLYSTVQIENLIREIVTRYKDNTVDSNAKGTKNHIINTVLYNAIVPAKYLSAFFDFIYDIYEVNFEYTLPEDLYDEFKMVYEGLRKNMVADNDILTINTNMSSKTYKLIKSTKNMIINSQLTEAIINLSIIIVKLIDKRIWGKKLKIYNPYLKEGFEIWQESITNESPERKSLGRSSWEPKFFLENEIIYLSAPLHRVKTEYQVWDIKGVILNNGKVVCEIKDPVVKEKIAVNTVEMPPIELNYPIGKIEYQLKCGDKVIYSSGDKLYRNVLAFSPDGKEIKNNTDYKGAVSFCSKSENDFLTTYYRCDAYCLGSKNVSYGDSIVFDDIVFNFSSLVKPGVFGEEYECVKVKNLKTAVSVQLFKYIKFLVFETEVTNKRFKFLINDVMHDISEFKTQTTVCNGVIRYVVELNLLDTGIYRIRVLAHHNGEKKNIAKFNAVVDSDFESKSSKLSESKYEIFVKSGLMPTMINKVIDVLEYGDECTSFVCDGKDYCLLIPFDFDIYRLSDSNWLPMENEIWIDDIKTDTKLDIYDRQIDEVYVYSSMGNLLEQLEAKDKGVYKEISVGFLCSYKNEYDYTVLAFMRNGKFKKGMFCSNKCVMRNSTIFNYDGLNNRLCLIPYYYGRGKVMLDVRDDQGQAVLHMNYVMSGEEIEIDNLESRKKYHFIFTEKGTSLLSLKGNRVLKDYEKEFVSINNLENIEFKIHELIFNEENNDVIVVNPNKKRIMINEKKEANIYNAELYEIGSRPGFKSNKIGDLRLEVIGFDEDLVEVVLKHKRGMLFVDNEGKISLNGSLAIESVVLSMIS